MTFLDSLFDPDRRPARAWAILYGTAALAFTAPILFPPAGSALDALDVRGLFLPWWETARAAILAGRLPVWDSAVFSGYPFLANPQVALFYPFTWIALILPPAPGLSWFLALHLWIAATGMYALMRWQGSTPPGAGLAGIVFGFSGFMAARILAGHVGLLAAHAWLPWLLAGTGWALDRRDWRADVIAGLPFGMVILAGHITSLIPIGLAWAAFVVYLGITRREWRAVGIAVGPALLTGIGLSAVQLILLIPLAAASSRTGGGIEAAAAYSMPPAHLFTLLNPLLFGEPTRIGYWSVPVFEEFAYYAGVLPLLGLALAIRRPGKSTIFYILLILFGLLLALGSYGFLFGWLYAILPPYRLARAPARAAVLFIFGAAALLAEAISRREDDPAENADLRWIGLGGVMVGMAALAGTLAAFALDHPSDTSGRLWHQAGGWAIFTLLWGIGAVLLAKFKADKHRAGLGLIALLLVDLFLFGVRFMRTAPAGVSSFWTEAAAQLEPGTRVLPWGLSIFEQNGANAVGLESVFGYNALEIAAYTNFVGLVPDPRSAAFDLLGVEAMLIGGPTEEFSDGERPLTLTHEGGAVWIYQRARAVNVVRLAYVAEVVPDPDTARAAIHDPAFDPGTVLLEYDPACDIPTPPGGGFVEVVEARDGYWRVITSSSSPALLVIAETNFPGWLAEIDGEAAPILNAYTTLKALCVPAGDHLVTLRYRPPGLIAGGIVSLLALGVVIWAGVSVKKLTSDHTS